MGVLLLKLASPLQSWGDDSRYSDRKTRHEPTKSGVIGLLASALGRRREDPIDDLACLRVAVRVDQPGNLAKDFQTAHKRAYDDDSSRWKMSPAGKDAYVTTRYYLSDAIFMAGIEAPDQVLHAYADALTHPAFPLFLGRRSCPPACKVLFGVRSGADLTTAMRDVPWQADSKGLIRRHQSEDRVPLDMFIDLAADGDEVPDHYENVHDAPVSYSQLYRQYEWRKTAHVRLLVTNPHHIREFDEHDPFAALEEGK